MQKTPVHLDLSVACVNEHQAVKINPEPSTMAALVVNVLVLTLKALFVIDIII